MATLLSYALTDVASVKESLGIASSVTTYDNLITRKINQATLAIENYCGRRFASTVYTDEDYNGTQIDQIVLKNRPVIGTPVLEVRDTTLNEDDFTTVEATLLFTNANAGILDLDFRAIGRWRRYRVTYTAGYTTIPEDLAEACVSLACFYYNEADSSSVGVSSKQEGQRKITYSNGSSPQTFKTIMQQLGIDGIIDSYANYPITSV
jgi:hypothetical protein